MKKSIQQLKNVVQNQLINLFFNRFLTKLDKNSIAIDCGANVGDISLKLAKTGAQVFAFEPNPFAYKELIDKVKDYKNVTPYNKGVWDKNTVTKLYFHNQAENDEAFWSFGSSIVKAKGNVDKERSIEVEIIDLTEFIDRLDKKVDLLKIDIEGAECELLEKFIKKELYKKVTLTLVETHDRKIDGQKKKTDRLRELIKEKEIDNINLSWL
ncbi:FkbM family methyltransferase [Flagellimonas onchidii]|uniref:FkbM family methyltransferase n=1 Tax=Flagellimonas onchidii TaxID=2562684 RepID=UPI001456044E|nr:FkbM family methyltransferase [Allomuricauda onchidii]